MDREHAKTIIKQAIDQALKKGAYSLEDALFILPALTELLNDVVIEPEKK